MLGIAETVFPNQLIFKIGYHVFQILKQQFGFEPISAILKCQPFYDPPSPHSRQHEVYGKGLLPGKCPFFSPKLMDVKVEVPGVNKPAVGRRKENAEISPALIINKLDR